MSDKKWIQKQLDRFGLQYAQCDYCGKEHSATPKNKCKNCAAKLKPLLGHCFGVPVYLVDADKASPIFSHLSFLSFGG